VSGTQADFATTVGVCVSITETKESTSAPEIFTKTSIDIYSDQWIYYIGGGVIIFLCCLTVLYAQTRNKIIEKEVIAIQDLANIETYQEGEKDLVLKKRQPGLSNNTEEDKGSALFEAADLDLLRNSSEEFYGEGE